MHVFINALLEAFKKICYRLLCPMVISFRVYIVHSGIHTSPYLSTRQVLYTMRTGKQSHSSMYKTKRFLLFKCFWTFIVTLSCSLFETTYTFKFRCISTDKAWMSWFNGIALKIDLKFPCTIRYIHAAYTFRSWITTDDDTLGNSYDIVDTFI